MLTLQAQKRDIKESLDKIRKGGKIPAVFYGAKEENTPITINAKDFQKMWKEAGESSAITIDTDGKKVSALIHDVSFDVVKGQPIHVDFLAIDMNKTIRVNVPIEFEGIAP